MVGTVAAVAQNQAEVVSGFRERGRDTQVAGEPVRFGLVPAQVTMARLQEDPQWLAGNTGDQFGVGWPPGI